MSAQPIYTDNDMKIALHEQVLGDINKTLIRFEKRFDRIDERFDKIDSDLKEIRKEAATQFRYVTGMILIGIIFPFICKLFHWI